MWPTVVEVVVMWIFIWGMVTCDCPLLRLALCWASRDYGIDLRTLIVDVGERLFTGDLAKLSGGDCLGNVVNCFCLSFCTGESGWQVVKRDSFCKSGVA